jgi:uncharacterized protein (DUF1330 family)
MAAYIIVQVEVEDPVRYEDYKRQAAAAIAACGGRFVVRGGKVETLEGTWNPGRLVVLEFPSVELAKAFWSSEAYRPAKELRQATARTEMIVVEGFSTA